MAKKKKPTAKDQVQEAVEKVKKKKPVKETIKEEPKKRRVSKLGKKEFKLEEFDTPEEPKQTLTNIVEEIVEHQDEEQEPELEQLLPKYQAKPPEQEQQQYQQQEQQKEEYHLPGKATDPSEEYPTTVTTKDDFYQHANVHSYRSGKEKKEHDPTKSHDPLSELIEGYSK